MDEYKVQWRHLRASTAADWIYREWEGGIASAADVDSLYADPKVVMFATARVWRRFWSGYAQHGGKTECRIYADDAPPLQAPVASAWAVCSWRDQFDRHVGRLYSLALAAIQLPDTPAHLARLVDEQLHLSQLETNSLWWAFQAVRFDGAPVSRIKAACAEIVQSWRKPKRDAWRNIIHDLYCSAMQCCDTAGDGTEEQEAFECCANLLGASNAMVDAMASPALNGDKREAIEICNQIVREWRSEH